MGRGGGVTKDDKLRAISDAISHRQSLHTLARSMVMPIYGRGRGVSQPGEACVDCGRYRGGSYSECDDVEPKDCWRPKGALLVWHEVEK